MSDNLQSFSAMLRRALGKHLAPNAQTFAEMFAPDGVMEFPFAGPGMPDRLQGRSALVSHLETLAEALEFHEIGEPQIHTTTDPETFILEFEGFGRGVKTGAPYRQRYISVIRIRGGYIAHYRDYWNPIAILQTLNGPAALGPMITGGSGD
jgi:ketosteroid isomerase-like protein